MCRIITIKSRIAVRLAAGIIRSRTEQSASNTREEVKLFTVIRTPQGCRRYSRRSPGKQEPNESRRSLLMIPEYCCRNEDVIKFTCTSDFITFLAHVSTITVRNYFQRISPLNHRSIADIEEIARHRNFKSSNGDLESESRNPRRDPGRGKSSRLYRAQCSE